MLDAAVSLTRALVRSTTFDDVAAAVARAMLEIAADCLEQSAFAERGRMLRAMVHFRPQPDDGYRRLSVIEHDLDPRQPVPEVSASYLPSATAWRWVASHRCAVSIDAVLGRVQPHAPGVAAHVQPSAPEDTPPASKETRDRWLERQVTHVCAFPLRPPGGAMAGMISLEAECRAALGKDLIYMLAGEPLQALADIAAPYLASLPLAAPATQAAQAAAAADEFLPVVGPSMAPLVAMLRVFARQEETILLSGPTGAGKSRLARWCTQQSPRRDSPFEVLDLMTVPKDLQMAELFGWKRGAFTGAVKDSPGSLVRAQGGTLFIDEIDKLSLESQAGLLHLLEERSYRPLGEAGAERRADVRFLIGTNANLFAEVEAGRFREDLYYRINVLPVKIPALDERADEIPLWAEYLLQRRHGESVTAGTACLHADAAHALVESRWPGNLRQLDNVIRRAYALSLMSHSSVPHELMLQAPEVERALGYEQPRAGGSLTDLLREAARRFVIEAELRAGPKGEREGLLLDHAEAFKGFVLALAEQRLGSREEAFRLLGKEALLANRNHHKPFRREIAKVEALYRALDEADRFPYHGLLDS